METLNLMIERAKLFESPELMEKLEQGYSVKKISRIKPPKDIDFWKMSVFFLDLHMDSNPKVLVELSTEPWPAIPLSKEV